MVLVQSTSYNTKNRYSSLFVQITGFVNACKGDSELAYL